MFCAPLRSRALRLRCRSVRPAPCLAAREPLWVPENLSWLVRWLFGIR